MEKQGQNFCSVPEALRGLFQDIAVFKSRGKGKPYLLAITFTCNSFICLGRQRKATTASRLVSTTNLELAPVTVEVEEPCKKHLFKYIHGTVVALQQGPC